jgi:signal transduction histidine kinase
MSQVETNKVLILTPIGRDGATVARLIERAGLKPVVCISTEELVAELERVVEVVVVAEEALYGSNIFLLQQWVSNQAPWSDQPFVVLTNRNEGVKFAAFRRELVTRLGNVTFLERPLQTITLQATVLSAVRGRRRQYEARAYLEEQRGAAERLESVVAERTRDLEEANARLRAEIVSRERAQAALIQAQKIEALGQLVGGVAHDFNNLLMVILGNLDLLSKGLGQDPRLRRLLSGAMEGARRGATLTQRLLAFARKQELQARATDLRALLADMSELINRSVGPMVRVNLVEDSDVPTVAVDPNQLEMALLNLAVNARDAMPSGGTLTILLRSEEVAAGADPDLEPGRYAVLAVRDTGEGMSKETLGKAVEPFFSTKPLGKGTGLGLSMVFGLAEQSGGALRLKSSPGMGTTVSLWLRAADEPPVVNGKEGGAAVQAAFAAKILVVDDDPLIASSTVALVEDLGHEVVEANSGREALELLNGGFRPDLVITDFAMPEMTGLELADEVRQRYPALPILLASGFADMAEIKSVDLPRLAKPYTQDQIANEIARLLPRSPA